MRSTPSLPSLPGPLWPEVVTPDRVLSMDKIELNSIFMLNWIVWNRTVLTFNCVNKKNYTECLVSTGVPCNYFADECSEQNYHHGNFILKC